MDCTWETPKLTLKFQPTKILLLMQTPNRAERRRTSPAARQRVKVGKINGTLTTGTRSFVGGIKANNSVHPWCCFVQNMGEAGIKWEKTALLHPCLHTRRRTGRKAAACSGCECKTFWGVVGNAGKKRKGNGKKQLSFWLALLS